MTGTAMTEAEEFHKIYKLEVVGDPDPPPDGPRGRRGPRLPQRERPSSTRSSTRSSRCRRPAGRSSSAPCRVEKSEILGDDAQAARHQARGPQRQVPREGSGRSSPRPGRTGAVTIATNMAGRGTDILLGGNPAGLASRAPPPARPQPGRGGQGDLRRGARRGEGDHATRTTSAWSRPAACTSSAPSATTAGASTTSSAAAPAARATRARRASTCRSTTTS